MVRGEASNEHLPATTVAAYSHLWIAALQQISDGQAITTLRPPKWRGSKDATLPSTGDLLRLLRYEYWASVQRTGNFYHFATGTNPDTNAEKYTPDLPATLLSVA